MSCHKHLHVDNVSFAYPGANNVLNHIQFDVSKGERTGLIGPNGAGKTTLFMLMCGILNPSEGTVTVNSRQVEHNQFNPEINYLFQMPDDQLFCSTLRDDVAFGPLNMKLSGEEVDERVQRALKQVDLHRKANTVPHHMSGGEKRLGAFATILSILPDILLLDEPSSNLDARNRRNLIDILLSIDNTLLIASHDLEFILELCNRVIIMDEGRIVADGKADEIMSDENLMKTHHMEKPHSLPEALPLAPGHAHQKDI